MSVPPIGPTPEQRQIVGLLAQGHTDRAAARRLGISVATLRRRVGQVSRALGVSSRLTLGIAIAEAGWLDDEQQN